MMSMAMTDTELAKFLGIDEFPPEKVSKYLADMPPAKRAAYERMSELTIELALYQQGLIMVREIDPSRNYIGIAVDSQWYSGKLTEFARHAIEQVTAPERGGGEG